MDGVEPNEGLSPLLQCASAHEYCSLSIEMVTHCIETNFMTDG